MKKRLIIAVFCFTAMAFVPFLSITESESYTSQASDNSGASEVSEASENSEISDSGEAEASDSSDDTSANEAQSDNYFKILDTSTGEIITVDDITFCYGAVAYEMPPSFEQEALKAQCVACYTYFSKLREEQRENPDSDLNGADFSADLSINQYYLSDEAMRETWGSLYEESYENIKSAVDAVFGEVLTDESGELITVFYHAISSGATESCVDVFGTEISYLQAVASPGDLIAPGYMSEYSISADEFKEKILSENSNAELSDDCSEWIGEIERTDSGTVKTIIIGGEEFQGTSIRELFGLRSASFEIESEDNNFTFTVYGYGHGVGMSQYGAEYMAQQGSDYKEILMHYYSGAVLALSNRSGSD